MAQEPTSAIEYWFGVEAIRNRLQKQAESPAESQPGYSVPLGPDDQ